MATSPALQAHLETHAATFLEGYHAALATPDVDPLHDRLEHIALERRGFAYEGAAMALTLLDRLTPWKRSRWRTFRDGPGDAHAYMMHVGAGWALARLRVRPVHMLRGYDPLLRWLVLDGYGFHQGFFATRDTIQGQALARSFVGYTARAFDQGIGRSLWFSQCATPRRIASTIRNFAETRHSDLWSGVGLAATYAGGVDADDLRVLQHEAQRYEAELAQGCCFAAKARLRAGNVMPHVEMACAVLLGCSADAAATVSDAALASALASSKRLETAPHSGVERIPAYELWRQQIREHVVLQGVRP